MGQIFKTIIAFIIIIAILVLCYMLFIEKKSLDSIFQLGKEKVEAKTLEFKVKSQIQFNKNLKDYEIEVKAEERVVTLTGTVDSPEKAVLAAQIADNVDGVDRVINRIKVSKALDDVANDGRSERERLLDRELEQKAQAVLDMSPELKGAEIKAVAFKRVIFISGRTLTEAQKDYAVKIVRRIDRVRDVKDDLRLKYE
jgi:hyperosmotically inducible protein